MPTTENTELLFAALAKAQAKFLPITRNRTAHVITEKGTYDYSYATLDRVIDAVTDALSECELSHYATIEAGKLVVTLAHSSGQRIWSEMPLPDPTQISYQRFGSAVTYARRYGLTPLLGVFNEDDEDANVADGSRVAGRKEAPEAPTTQLWHALAAQNISGPAALVWCEEHTGRNITHPRELSAEELQMLIRVATGKEEAKKIRPKATAAQIDQLNTLLDEMSLVSPPEDMAVKEVTALKKTAKLAWIKERLGRGLSSARELFGDEADKLITAAKRPEK